MLLVSGLAFLAAYAFSSSNARTEVQATVEKQAQDLGELLKQPLWNFDDHEVGVIGHLFFENAHIDFLKVTNSSGEIVFSKGGAGPDTSVLRNLDIVYRDTIVGRLHYSVSPDYFRQLRSRFFWDYVISVGSILLTAYFVTAFFLRRLLGASMGEFTASVNKFSGGQEAAFDDGVTYREFIPLVTALQEMAHKRTSARAELANIFDLSLDLIGAGNLEGYFTKVNSSFKRLLGYDESELLAKPFLEFVHEDDLETTIKALEEAAKSDKAFSVVNRYKCKDGSLKWIEWNVLSNVNENIFYATGRDITDRRAAEEQLDSYRENLESLVKERTQELHDTQDALVQKERLATLGQLTATVSHELRNPLGAMRTSTYLINQGLGEVEDEKIVRSLERLDRNISRCDHIIDELLDFTRAHELNKSAVQIDQWLGDVIAEQSIPNGVDVDMNLSLGDLEMKVDPDRLRRAVINVVENACHAMMDDNQQLVVAKQAKLGVATRKRGDHIEITVSDNGSGIPSEVLDKIFEPLFSTKGFGVGLGMPTVLQIMRQHGGGVGVESEAGKGTTITLWLPV